MFFCAAYQYKQVKEREREKKPSAISNDLSAVVKESQQEKWQNACNDKSKAKGWKGSMHFLSNSSGHWSKLIHRKTHNGIIATVMKTQWVREEACTF